MCTWVVALALTVPSQSVDVQTLDGKAVAGVLRGVTAGAVVIEMEGETRTLPSRELLEVRLTGPLPRLDNPEVAYLLGAVDGSVIAVSSLLVDRGRAALQPIAGSPLRASTNTLRWVRARPRDRGREGGLIDQWQAILESSVSGDVLVIHKTSQVTDASGAERTEAALDHLEGILGDVTATHVAFQFENTRVEVPLERVYGLIYYRPPRAKLPPLVCVARTGDGSQWHVRSLETRGDELSLTTTAGLRATLPLERLDLLDYSAANLIYLSALQPESVDWRPHLITPATPHSISEWFLPRIDPQPCVLRGVHYQHGVSLRSRTQLSYRLQSDYRRFRATVGIGDPFRETGNVRLVVTANQRVLFDGQIAGGDRPLELDLDVRAARRLNILVDFGSDGTDVGDHLVLANPRLTK